jgi:hypothetical protein
MRYVVRFAVIAPLVLIPVLVGCGGGSSATTLHGTFIDTNTFLTGKQGCADQESGSGYTVSVSVDNIAAGSANVTFDTGKPLTSGLVVSSNNAPIYSCVGTWQIKVPTAHVSYSLSVGGSTGDLSGHVIVSVLHAGSTIQLNDGSTGANLYQGGEGSIQPNS